MKRDTAIDILKRHREQLAAIGVAHAYLFGSVARDEATEDSDIDVMIDVAYEPFGIFDIIHVKHTMEDFFLKSVDVVIREDARHGKNLKKIVDQAVHVF